MPVNIDGSGFITGVAGSILQVVNAYTQASVQNNTNAFADTGLSATITPSSSSSKILVLVNQVELSKDTNNTGVALRLFRNSTGILDMAQNAGYTNSTARNDIGSVSASFLDSPNTTSSITYKTQFASAQNNAAVFVQRGGIAYSTITLLEVAA